MRSQPSYLFFLSIYERAAEVLAALLARVFFFNWQDKFPTNSYPQMYFLVASEAPRMKWALMS